MSAKDHPNHVPGVPMLMPPWLENLQIRFMNPVMKRIAPRLPGFAIVHHRGRSSGRDHETVVNHAREGDLLIIGLIHGKTNWVKNVIAAGGARVDTSRRSMRVTNPRVVERGSTDPELPDKVHRMAKRAGVFIADIT